jgi:CCR4-NOT transcription complex subunit 7/8
MKTLLKKIMSIKLMTALLTTASICIISCQKETKDPGNIPLQAVQESNMVANVKANAADYRSSAEKSYQLLLAKRKAAKQSIEKCMLKRNQFSRSSVSGKSVIHVPQDYSTLQEAVDNSTNGGNIIIDGTVLQSGNVMVDVPNLTIQGGNDEKSATINDNSNTGDNLIVTVSGVTIKNLKLLNIGININNTNSETLMNLNASNSNPGILSVIALYGSTNTAVKNCNISYSVLGVGDVTGIGIYLDDSSNNNQVTNCAVSNTQFTGFDIEGSNNRINNCEAFNFYRGFISFDGVATGNVYTGCIANHSYADAGFVFLNFNSNNTTVTLNNCTANDNVAFASIVYLGGSAIISNCTASSNTRNIFGDFGNYPAGIVIVGIGQTGEFANVSNCKANSNSTNGIVILDMNFQVTNNTCNKNLGTLPATGALTLISDNGLPMSGIVKDNITDSNSNYSIGIYLVGVINSTIINNRSMNNAVCDFDQTNCSGNILTNNKFGTSCTDL